MSISSANTQGQKIPHTREPRTAGRRAPIMDVQATIGRQPASVPGAGLNQGGQVLRARQGRAPVQLPQRCAERPGLPGERVPVTREPGRPQLAVCRRILRSRRTQSAAVGRAEQEALVARNGLDRKRVPSSFPGAADALPRPWWRRVVHQPRSCRTLARHPRGFHNPRWLLCDLPQPG